MLYEASLLANFEIINIMYSIRLQITGLFNDETKLIENESNYEYWVQKFDRQKFDITDFRRTFVRVQELSV